MADGKIGAFSTPFERERMEVVLPSGRKATILETTGREERIISFLRQGRNSQTRVNEYMAGVTENLDGKPGHPDPQLFDSMLSGDRTYILLCSRVLTHGPLVTYKLTCRCGEASEHEISIQEIIDSMVPYPHGDEREFSVDLPEGKLYFSMYDGKAERRVAQLTDPDMNGRLRAINLWEVAGDKGKLPVDLDNLKSKHILALRQEVKAHECKLETTCTVQCTSCQGSTLVDVMGSIDFLFPGTT